MYKVKKARFVGHQEMHTFVGHEEIHTCSTQQSTAAHTYTLDISSNKLSTSHLAPPFQMARIIITDESATTTLVLAHNSTVTSLPYTQRTG